MIGLFLVAVAVAGAPPSPEASVPEAIVFDVCRAGWPDALRGDTGARRFEAQADLYSLDREQRLFVRHRCAQFAVGINERLSEVRFDARTGKVVQSNPR
jgi:hypothetical protein